LVSNWARLNLVVELVVPVSKNVLDRAMNWERPKQWEAEDFRHQVWAYWRRWPATSIAATLRNTITGKNVMTCKKAKPINHQDLKKGPRFATAYLRCVIGARAAIPYRTWAHWQRE